MIHAEMLKDTDEARIVLRADGAWSWQTNLPLIVALALASLIVAGITLAMGAWMVPFFSVFELAMVVLAISICIKRAGVQEVLTFSSLMVKFERGRDQPEETIDIERFYARFLVRYPRSRMQRPEVRLQYRQDGKRHQRRIGEFLNTEEVLKLEKALRQVIKRLDA